MTSNQFFVPRLEEGASLIVLRGEEHRHLAKAARVRPGDSVWLFDADGRRCLAEVVSVGRERSELRALRREGPEGRRVSLALVQAMLQAKKMEFLVQKAAELGCAEFSPVITERSLREAVDRSGRKLERWTKIAFEATKQSKGALATVVRAPRALKAYLRDPGPGRKLLLSERGGRPLKDILADRKTPPGPEAPSVSLLIGPEGGWSVAEEGLARESGFEAASLGHRILKAETAALAAAAMVLHFWGE